MAAQVSLQLFHMQLFIGLVTRLVPISVQLALVRQDVKERESSDDNRSRWDDSYNPRRSVAKVEAAK